MAFAFPFGAGVSADATALAVACVAATMASRKFCCCRLLFADGVEEDDEDDDDRDGDGGSIRVLTPSHQNSRPLSTAIHFCHLPAAGGTGLGTTSTLKGGVVHIVHKYPK